MVGVELASAAVVYGVVYALFNSDEPLPLWSGREYCCSCVLSSVFVNPYCGVIRVSFALVDGDSLVLGPFVVT